MPLKRLALVLVAVAAIACRGSETDRATDVGGTVVIVLAEPDFLLPPVVTSLQGKVISDMLFERLAEMGPQMSTIGDRGWIPRLAQRWSWATDSLSIAFHMHPEARWHDGHPVRASDVKFSFDLLTNPAVGAHAAPLLGNIDSVSVQDSLTAIVWFEKRAPEQFFEFVFNVTIVPEHLLRAVPPAELRTASLARQPVGSGPFRFVRWDAGQRIELIADTTHRDGRPSLDRLIFSIAADAQTASAQLLSGQADFHEIVTGDNVQAVQQHPDLKVIPYTSLQYGYVGFNLRDPGAGTRPHPIFADRSVRRALTMALDRQAMVRNVFDTLAMVPIGPTVRTLAAPDTNLSQIPHDLEGARRMLDSLGWRDTNGDGIRERNGRPLRFSLSFPTSSRPRARFAVLIQEQLKQAGVQVDLEPLEFNVWATRHREGKFDTVIGAWIADPSPGSIRQTWTSAGLRGRGGSNHSSYQNPVFDALVDSAVAEFDAAKSKRHLLRAYQVIIDDAPAIWLYEPRLVAGAHKRLRVTGMRIDAWWAGIPRWSIPPGERIARDRIGLRPQAE